MLALYLIFENLICFFFVETVYHQYFYNTLQNDKIFLNLSKNLTIFKIIRIRVIISIVSKLKTVQSVNFQHKFSFQIAFNCFLASLPLLCTTRFSERQTSIYFPGNNSDASVLIEDVVACFLKLPKLQVIVSCLLVVSYLEFRRLKLITRRSILYELKTIRFCNLKSLALC